MARIRFATLMTVIAILPATSGASAMPAMGGAISEAAATVRLSEQMWCHRPWWHRHFHTPYYYYRAYPYYRSYFSGSYYDRYWYHQRHYPYRAWSYRWRW